MKNLSLDDFRGNESILMERKQLKLVRGGLEVRIICRKGWSFTILGERVTRWSCNNSEGDFITRAQLEKGYWIEKERFNLNGFER